MRRRVAGVLALATILVAVVVVGAIGGVGGDPMGGSDSAGTDARGAESGGVVRADGSRAGDRPAGDGGVVVDGDAVGDGDLVGDSGFVEGGGRAGLGDVPVVLVPGWLDTARDLAALRIRLLGAGWPDGFVETVTFEVPTGSNRTHARELAEIVDTLLARTGAEKVDVVAHSMGGLATRWYLRTHPGAPVRRVAFLGSPHRGTLAAHLAWGEGREEMMPESPFLDTLNAQAPAPDGVEAITIRTVVDTHIVPGESATLPGVVDHELCCPTHPGLIRDDEVFEIVLEFLERGLAAGSSGDTP